jgi:hypothetical protein
MPTTRETLIEEIIFNARRDRKRLEAVADGLVGGFVQVKRPDEDPTEEFDPEVAAAFAEEISKIGDSLSKITHELVELVKLSRRSEDGPVKRLDAGELEATYDLIQPEEKAN